MMIIISDIARQQKNHGKIQIETVTGISNQPSKVHEPNPNKEQGNRKTTKQTNNKQ